MAVMNEKDKKSFRANANYITSSLQGILDMAHFMTDEEIKRDFETIRNLLDVNEKLALGQEVE